METYRTCDFPRGERSGLPAFIRILTCFMRGSRNFRQGGGGSRSVFLVLSLFYRSQMVNFKEIYHFSRFQRGPTFSRGVQLFPRGSNCLFSIETHITCDFPGGGGGPDPLPPPPLDPHLRFFFKTFFTYLRIFHSVLNHFTRLYKVRT